MPAPYLRLCSWISHLSFTSITIKWSKDNLNNLKKITKKDKTAAEITILFNKMSTTIASTTTTRTIDGIQAKYIELGLPYKVMKKAKNTKKARSIKKVRRESTKNARKEDATVIASGSNALSTSY